MISTFNITLRVIPNMKLNTVNKENSEPNEAHQLAENLCSLLKSHHLNATSLAQKLDIPMMTIRRLLSGETTDPRISTLKLIADYFRISIDDLIAVGNPPAIQSLKRTKAHLIPILDWETAEKMISLHDLNLPQWKEWQSLSLSEEDAISKNAFALESRPSMYPRFPKGTIFIIDPDSIPTDGDIVLVKIKKNNELTLRELHIDPPEWQLRSVISGSNSLQYVKREHEIVGVILLTMLYNRKM